MGYATVAAYVADPHTDLTTAPTGDDLVQLQSQLDDASDLLDDMLVNAVYPHDTNGMPTWPAHITALSDACIAQTLYSAETGDDLGIEYGATVLGPLQLPAGGAAASGRFAPNAIGILRRARLITAGVHARGWW